MSHCIQPSRNVAPSMGENSELLPTTGEGADAWRRPVLTIQAQRPGRKEARFLFREETRGGASGFVVDPWGDSCVEVTGEDLFAFRELLNELPEEAFVRPTDPPETYYVLEDNDGDWWASRDGEDFLPVLIDGRHHDLDEDRYTALTLRHLFNSGIAPTEEESLVGALVRVGSYRVGTAYRGLVAEVAEELGDGRYRLDFGPAAKILPYGDGGPWRADSFEVIRKA